MKVLRTTGLTSQFLADKQLLANKPENGGWQGTDVAIPADNNNRKKEHELGKENTWGKEQMEKIWKVKLW